MTTAYTSLLGFALPVTGELNGTWGDVVNNSITQLVEDSVAGTATASVTSGDWTLSTTGSGASNQARCAVLVPTGTPGVARNIIAPSQSKAYIVINQSDADVVVKGSATTGVTIASGDKALVAWDGTDFIQVGSAAGGIGYVYKSANYTADTNEGVLADTTSGTFTVTLPAGPAVGDQVVVADAAGTWGTNNLTVARNGSTIAGLAENLTCDISGASVQFVYTGSTWAVYAQIGGNGGNVVTLDGIQTLTNKTISGASNTITVDGTNSVGYLKIPQSGSAKTTSYSLTTGDVGEMVVVGSGGSITIPDATFSAGDVVLVYNDTTGNITITCTITTAYIGGTNTDKATVSLATRGVCNILFISGTVCVITGNVS